MTAIPAPATHTASTAITVTSVADLVADDGVCTLPEVVTSANSGTASGATAGECAPGGPATLITFAPALSGQTIALTVAHDSAAGPSGLGVTSDITIDGLAGGITIARSEAAPNMRLFYVAPAGSLTLRRLTLHGGVARGANGGGVISDSFMAGGGGGAGLGGAIFNRGALRVEASTLTGNQAIGGDGGFGGYFPPTNVFAVGGGGGGLDGVTPTGAAGGGPSGADGRAGNHGYSQRPARQLRHHPGQPGRQRQLYDQLYRRHSDGRRQCRQSICRLCANGDQVTCPASASASHATPPCSPALCDRAIG